MLFRSTKRASQKHTLKSTPASEKHNLEFSKAQQNESSPYTRFKERTDARACDPEQNQTAYNEVAYAAGHNVAGWLRDHRDFDFVRAFDLWGEQLEELWKAAVRADSRKPGDKAKFRF